MCKEKAPIYKLSRSKTPKTQQICHYRHATKTSGTFLFYDMNVDFNSPNNFAKNFRSFAKVSVPLQFIIPWFSHTFTTFMMDFIEFDKIAKALNKYEVYRFSPNKVQLIEFGDGGVAIIDQWIAAHAR